MNKHMSRGSRLVDKFTKVHISDDRYTEVWFCYNIDHHHTNRHEAEQCVADDHPDYQYVSPDPRVPLHCFVEYDSMTVCKPLWSAKYSTMEWHYMGKITYQVNDDKPPTLLIN